ncbi:MAG: hypothetical protein JJU45_08070 [Acidimicrobiia bacterium]|nr:hypothetical protein [Acidimicrobiia bacterium]
MTTPVPDPLAEAAAVVDEIGRHADALASRRRRLLRSLRDLGLLDALGGSHNIAIGDDGFEIGPLTSRQSDDLVRRTEDLAAGFPPPSVQRNAPAGPGQLSFDDF